MYYFFLFLLSLSFFSFAKGKITFYREKNYFSCNGISALIENIESGGLIESNYIEKKYALNPQNCRINDPNELFLKSNPYVDVKEEDKCCFVSFLYKEKWYYFCGKISKADYITGIDKFIDDLKERKSNIFVDPKNKLSIDCLGEKLKLIMKFLFMIQLFLF